ncbi:pilus assembly protein PilP [Thauera sinica]|uniref:Pilus assembly protein PilP n=1 Tax=Thauera sinica TaxID=2665146 RepID=A0ABW1ATS7_9RHOO|nr:pilus assembly protein PilP [Thauera sp. K11]
MTVLACCLGLAACSGDAQDDIRGWMDEQAKTMRGSVKPLPEIKPFPVVAYAAAGLVEPFRASRLEPEKAPGGVRPNLERRKEPLEAYPLESLKMVGVMRQRRAVNALVMADKSLYQVKVGNYMGQNFGIVTDISDTSMTLRELVEDVNGDWVERVSTLMLQERQEGRK